MFRLPQTKFTSGSAFNSLRHPKVEFKLLCQQLVGSKKRQERRMRGGRGGDEEGRRRADRSVLGAPWLCSACTHWLSIAFQGLMPSTPEMNMIIWMWQQMLCSRKCFKRVTQLQKRKEKKDTPKSFHQCWARRCESLFHSAARIKYCLSPRLSVRWNESAGLWRFRGLTLLP